MKKTQWTLTDNELHNLVMAIISHQRETRHEGIPNCTPAEVEEYIQSFEGLATKLNEIRRAFRIDREDEDDFTSPWMERDQVLITIKPKPGDEIYTVIPWGDQWAVVEKANPVRPVGEHLYAASTHAHRKKRELNKAARMNAWPVESTR